jgi:hypothetical protein
MLPYIHVQLAHIFYDMYEELRIEVKRVRMIKSLISQTELFHFI